MDSINIQERTLRISNIEEEDHGLYRCIQGDIILNEILLDVLSKCIDDYFFVLTKQIDVKGVCMLPDLLSSRVFFV
jgi:hypothetical protein